MSPQMRILLMNPLHPTEIAFEYNACREVLRLLDY